MSAALAPYRRGFSHSEEAFVTFHDIAADKTLAATTYTRGDFWELGKKAATALQRLGAVRGDRVLHVFSGSRFAATPSCFDLVLHR